MFGDFPQPTQAMQVDHANQVIATAIGIAGLVAAIGFSVWWWWKRGSALPVLLLAGGALCATFEPVLDVLGLCWHPRANQFGPSAFEFAGRPIPWFVVLIYSWYFGFGAWLVCRRLQAGKRDFLRMFVVVAVFEGALETVGASVLKSYFYYGQQPWNLWGLPLWWPAMNAIPTIAGGVMLWIFLPSLQRLRSVAVIGLVPMVTAAAYLAVGLPVFLALNTDQPLQVTTAATALQAATTVLVIVFLRRLTELVDRAPAGS